MCTTKDFEGSSDSANFFRGFIAESCQIISFPPDLSTLRETFYPVVQTIKKLGFVTLQGLPGEAVQCFSGYVLS